MSKLRRQAQNEDCVRCGNGEEGKVVLCHYSGPRQHSFGKGRSIKGHDIAAAFLCNRCHDYFDHYETGNTVERSEEFLYLCLLTNIRRAA